MFRAACRATTIGRNTLAELIREDVARYRMCLVGLQDFFRGLEEAELRIPQLVDRFADNIQAKLAEKGISDEVDQVLLLHEVLKATVDSTETKAPG
jgi:hypothetical protein